MLVFVAMAQSHFGETLSASARKRSEYTRNEEVEFFSTSEKSHGGSGSSGLLKLGARLRQLQGTSDPRRVRASEKP